MADDIVISIDAPTVDAPISVNFGSLFEGFKATIDGVVDDVKSGDSAAITGLFLATMFLVAGLFVWRRI